MLNSYIASYCIAQMFGEGKLLANFANHQWFGNFYLQINDVYHKGSTPTGICHSFTHQKFLMGKFSSAKHSLATCIMS